MDAAKERRLERYDGTEPLRYYAAGASFVPQLFARNSSLYDKGSACESQMQRSFSGQFGVLRPHAIGRTTFFFPSNREPLMTGLARRTFLGGMSLAASTGLMGLATPLMAGDWPQILGPFRSGVAENEPPLGKFPAGGPPQLWKAKLGSGYAGPAVVSTEKGSRVVAFHRVKDQERLEAFDAITGKSVWQADFQATYRGGIDADKGPRCVPLVSEGKVYGFGAGGGLYCVELATGKTIWQRDLYGDYNGDEGYFGAGTTPIALDGKILVNVGGKGAGLVAVDAKTGKTVWQATSEVGSYSAPTSIEWKGKRCGLFVTRLNCVVVDPKDGKVLATVPFGQRGPTVNAATPLVIGDEVFLSASYGIGAKLLSTKGGELESVWSNDKSLSSQYATAVAKEDVLFGSHGREDAGAAELRCVERATGKVLWSKTSQPICHVILVQDKLLVLGIDGTLRVIEASKTKYIEVADAELTTDLTRALPALSNGVLYLRTNTRDGGGELLAYRVAGK